MSYVRHTWSGEDGLTNAKMNNIEDGIEEAMQSGGKYSSYDYVIYDNIVSGTLTATKGTFAGIRDMLLDGEVPVGLYMYYYDSGNDWITTATSQTMHTGWNPSAETIILSIIREANYTAVLEWSLSGIVYVD